MELETPRVSSIFHSYTHSRPRRCVTATMTLTASEEKRAMKSSSSSVAESDVKDQSVRVEQASGDLDLEKLARVGVYNEHIDVSHIDERKLLWKLDMWLVPWLSFLYLLSFLDRTSIGNAKVSTAVAC